MRWMPQSALHLIRSPPMTVPAGFAVPVIVYFENCSRKAQGKENHTLAQKENDNAYNRLKARRQKEKISKGRMENCRDQGEGTVGTALAGRTAGGYETIVGGAETEPSWRQAFLCRHRCNLRLLYALAHGIEIDAISGMRYTRQRGLTQVTN